MVFLFAYATMSISGTFPEKGVAMIPRRPSSAVTRCSPICPVSLLSFPDATGIPFVQCFGCIPVISLVRLSDYSSI